MNAWKDEETYWQTDGQRDRLFVKLVLVHL